MLIFNETFWIFFGLSWAFGLVFGSAFFLFGKWKEKRSLARIDEILNG